MTNSKWKISFSELDNILKKLQVLLLDEISNNKKIIDELKTTLALSPEEKENS